MSTDRARWRRRDLDPVCPGAVHVIPVPRWQTVEQAWEAQCDGTFVADPECTWGIVECPGGPDCPCLNGEIADTYQHRQHGQLVYDHASTLALDR